MKKNKIISTITIIILIICTIQGIRYANWKNYYNKMWEPLISSFHNSGSKIDSLGDHYIENPEYLCYLYPPKTYKYHNNLQVSENVFYDDTNKEEQFMIGLIIWPEKNGTYTWGIMIDRMESYGSSIGICSVYINPETLQIVSENPTEEDKQLIAANKDRIEALIKQAYSVFGSSIK